MKVSLYKGRHRQWVLSCTTQRFACGGVGVGSSEYVALASEVMFWGHSSEICLELEMFQLCTVTLSQWLVISYFHQKLLYKIVVCIVLL